MTPEQTLIAAAAKLREAAMLHRDTVNYLSLMNPGLELALADWLEDAAVGDDHGEHSPYALAYARKILGEDQT